MKKYSKSLRWWGDFFLLFGILLLIAGVVTWSVDVSSWPLTTGFWMIVLSPVVHGFAAVVQNAEEQIEERHDVI